MKLSARIETSLRGLLARTRRSVFLLLGVAVGIALLVFLTAFSYGVKTFFFDKMIRTFPANRVEVKPLRVVTEDGKAAPGISDETIAKIKAMPGVKGVLPMTALTFPALMASSTINFQTECAVYGIEPELVAPDLTPEQLAAFQMGGDIAPAVISSHIMELYNMSFAGSRNLPRLDRDFVLSKTVDLYLGQSTIPVAATRIPRRVECRIVGVSPQAPLMGISVPAQYVEDWEAWYHDPQRPPNNYVALMVNAESPIETDRIAEAISALGLLVTSGKDEARKLTAIARLVMGFISVISVAILFLVGIGIMNGLAMSVMEQSVRIGILRASGARKGDVLSIFLIEAMVIGLVGGAMGIGLGFLLTRMADYVAGHYMPPLPFMPESFFLHSAPTTLLILVFGVLMSCVSGLPPALRAANLDPAEALRSG
ncbi:MAG: FtsX-like permease family protein [Planctomycetota bacterium]